jgi:hypothetical protein
VASAARASGPGPGPPGRSRRRVFPSPAAGRWALMLYGANAVLSARALLHDVFGPDPAASKTFF